jgi:hypothetical protein
MIKKGELLLLILMMGLVRSTEFVLLNSAFTEKIFTSVDGKILSFFLFKF